MGVFRVSLTKLHVRKCNLLAPILALGSIRFYYDVIYYRAGIGVSYVLGLCAIAALFASIQVQRNMELLKSLELSYVVTQIPPSYISPQGVLATNNPNDAAPELIYNSRQVPVIAFNLGNAAMPDTPAVVPITITATDLIINAQEGKVFLPWKTFYGDAGGPFEPLSIAKAIDEGLDSGLLSIWLVVSLWLFIIVGIAVSVSALIIRVAAKAFLTTLVMWTICFRLAAYGSTLILYLLLAQFFFHLSLSYLLLLCLPAIPSFRILLQIHNDVKRAIADPNYALDHHNEMFLYYEQLSRIDVKECCYDGRLPHYTQAEPQERERRRANVQRILQSMVHPYVVVYNNQFNQMGVVTIEFKHFSDPEVQHCFSHLVYKFADGSVHDSQAEFGYAKLLEKKLHEHEQSLDGSTYLYARTIGKASEEDKEIVKEYYDMAHKDKHKGEADADRVRKGGEFTAPKQEQKDQVGNDDIDDQSMMDFFMKSKDVDKDSDSKKERDQKQDNGGTFMP